MALKYKIVKLNFFFEACNADIANTGGTCQLCQRTLNDKQQTVAVGLCRHAFHKICLNRAKIMSCPIDNIAWHEVYTLYTKK